MLGNYTRGSKDLFRFLIGGSKTQDTEIDASPSCRRSSMDKFDVMN